jgi:hypothetical protein
MTTLCCVCLIVCSNTISSCTVKADTATADHYRLRYFQNQNNGFHRRPAGVSKYHAHNLLCTLVVGNPSTHTVAKANEQHQEHTREAAHRTEARPHTE